jgi:Mrp family chromosome partitioning ATPase
VFSSNVPAPVRQVVFSAVEGETDVSTICRRAGEVLAMETTGQVAIVGDDRQSCREEVLPESNKPLRQCATRLRGNLWFVPMCWRERSTVSLHVLMGEIRSQFDFSIVEAPPAGESNQAAAMAQFADGIILVLLAQRTRRVTAERVKETLEQAQARLLGAVLSEREFPVPEVIYRRL